MPGGVAGTQFIRTAPYADCGSFFHAAGCVEADLPAAAAFAFFAVVIALLSIAARDSVRLAQAAFHVGAAEACADFLADDRLAFLAAAEQITATIVLLADYHQFSRARRCRCLASVGSGQWDGLAAAGGVVACVLQVLLLIAGATVTGEGDMAAVITTPSDQLSYR